MVLQKINNLRRRESGFTIVELLIVIVVIGILAAITIIAYNGITAKANAANSRSNAETVQKIAEAYNADNGTYPTGAQILTYGTTASASASTDSSKLPTSLANGGTSAVATGPTPTGALTTGSGIVVGGAAATNCAGGTSTAITCLGAVNGTKDIIYVPTTTAGAGACIGYYDYVSATQWVYAGTASAPTYAATSKYTCA